MMTNVFKMRCSALILFTSALLFQLYQVEVQARIVEEYQNQCLPCMINTDSTTFGNETHGYCITAGLCVTKLSDIQADCSNEGDQFLSPGEWFNCSEPIQSCVTGENPTSNYSANAEFQDSIFITSSNTQTALAGVSLYSKTYQVPFNSVCAVMIANLYFPEELNNAETGVMYAFYNFTTTDGDDLPTILFERSITYDKSGALPGNGTDMNGTTLNNTLYALPSGNYTYLYAYNNDTYTRQFTVYYSAAQMGLKASFIAFLTLAYVLSY